MTVWGLLGGVLVIVRQMRTFAVANEMDCGSCFREFVSGLVAWNAFVTGDPGENGWTFPVF